MSQFNYDTEGASNTFSQSGTEGFPFSYRFEELHRYHEKTVQWHWHNGMEISFIIAGTIECYFRKEKVVMQAGDVCFINQGIIHRMVSPVGGLVATFCFGADFIAPIGSSIHLKYVVPIISSGVQYDVMRVDTDCGESILKELIRVQNDVEVGVDAWEMQAKAGIIRAWSIIYRKLNNGKIGEISEKTMLSNRTYRRLIRMLEYIHENYSERISLDSMATAINISKSEILRSFKDGLDTTPMAYVTQYRLSQAKDFLQNTDESVSQIALRCGFDNSSYFCKVFKSHLGMSPLQFCEMYAQKEKTLK